MVCLWKFLGVVIAISVFFGNAAKADVRVIDATYEKRILITGTIKESDAEILEAMVPEIEKRRLWVYLNSEGGDVLAAMRIGRLIRKYEGYTQINPTLDLVQVDSVLNCYSSCALIFIGGVQRVNSGRLGLHRPYLASEPKSRSEIEQQVPQMLSMIKTYIAEMGITEEFYEKMMSTEPSHMIVYKRDESKTIVPEYDPVYDEVRIAYLAREFGLTTSETRRREIAALACFKRPEREYRQHGSTSWVCYQSVMWGINERDYLDREPKMLRECALSAEEKTLYRATPFKLRLDLPFLIRMENCIRRVFIGR